MDRQRSDFEEFAIACTPALLRSAYLLTGDRHLAEDLVQSALARTHRAWKRVGRDGNPQAYTRKTMYHLQVSWWRRRKVPESLTDIPVERPVADATGEVDLKVSLRAALFQLSRRHRAVVVLRYFEDRSVAQTAEILGRSEGTVKTQTLRALSKLRSVLPTPFELTNGATS
ncbi:SigE family RNA polymerase sigma factor [Stackebrandtia nassauensis]|uniref:RNA polymerase, sigma-24 subunit, ECF subfamily n=1 Tax=Stackebrandtia nassauensis (strain DSM 44728 / CIP 108903 / NRRL B-16338 / NBRC 102104 / LLR-40K-21) TaxID=446470 RepID=D3PXK1_STANL|nr:SigE family RNA polymerase sigma factor [Stackebrandtia nassauensis]ADD43331.1 RNA polymerase, sigma-24 subunit, ECF subfamily [Stackebrandtia nassauensis DSM 44728]